VSEWELDKELKDGEIAGDAQNRLSASKKEKK
jgi:hypothetical protein